MAKALRFPCDLARIGADAASKAGYALVAAMVTHKIKSMLLAFKQRRAIIIATLEGGEAVTNTIPSGQLIKLLHDRLEKQANNTLRGKDLIMMQIAVLMELQKAEQNRYFPRCSFLLCIFNFFDKKKKSEPIPNRDDVRISQVWWSIADSNR